MERGNLGFDYYSKSNGDVIITRNGKDVTTLRNAKASEFLDEVGSGESNDDQQLMARVTGNYKRGNERLAKSHPRNRR